MSAEPTLRVFLPARLVSSRTKTQSTPERLDPESRHRFVSVDFGLVLEVRVVGNQPAIDYAGRGTDGPSPAWEGASRRDGALVAFGDPAR